MKHTLMTRWLALLLVLSLGLSTAALGVDAPEAGYETAVSMAFGEAQGYLENLQLAAWTNNALDAEAMRELVNQETLYPQKTGWKELDEAIAKLLEPYGDADTYTKLRGAYDYLVKNITYSWYGYTQQVAPAYNKFGLDYLSGLHYQEGLQKSIPDDMANRTYHILTEKKGVCYDYAIAIAVIARYIGIESYVHTGYFRFETGGGGHHGWAILKLGGKQYVFDPQRDARNFQYHGWNGYYFGIPVDVALNSNYVPNYFSADAKANPERDASMLPVKDFRNHMVEITCIPEGSGTGTITGAGGHVTNTTATLTATPEEGSVFAGWFDGEGKLLTVENPYTFSVADAVTLYPRFYKKLTHTLLSSRSGTATGGTDSLAGQETTVTATPKQDAAFDGWYSLDGKKRSPDADYTFTPEKNTTLVAMFQGDVFYDIPENAWYLEEAMTAAERKLVNGTTPITFSAEMKLTRGMAVTILARMSGDALDEGLETPFVDVEEGAFYQAPVAWAYYRGVIKGIDSRHFAPDSTITRQEFMEILARYLTNVAGITLEVPSNDLPFRDADQISDWARDSVCQIYNLGLVKGYPNGCIAPKDTLTRAEGVTLLVRADDYLRSLEAEPADPQEPQT